MMSSKLLFRMQKLYNRNCFVRFVNAVPTSLAEDKTEEIKIPVPWGHVAGKWWGSKNQRPILCVHGWQDNANSFDTLIPLLPPEHSYLAIDLPGHGYSSHLPKGIFYRINDMVGVLRRIQQSFGWPKVDLIGHSYGSSLCFLFSSYFSNSVGFFVALDMIKPLSYYAEKRFKRSPEIIEGMIHNDLLDPETSPLYKKSELLERCIKGSNGSLTHESAEVLFKRGTDKVNELYKLKRDTRLKNILHPVFNQKQHMDMAKLIKCNILFLKAENSPFYDSQEDVESVVNLLKRNGKRVEYHIMPGSHHFHLNTPKVLAPSVSSFINMKEK